MALWIGHLLLTQIRSCILLMDLFEYILYVAIAGVAAYNNHKLKKEASHHNSDDSQDVAEAIPLTASSTPNR